MNCFRFLAGMTILLSFAQSTMAQENFVPGYIVSLKGDTVKGFIDFRNRDFSPDKVVIRVTETTERTTYSPLDIRAYGVLGEAYVSAVVQFNTVSNTSQDLEENARIRIGTDTTFLKVLIGGTKSLYQYSDRQGDRQFYIPKKDSFELLLYKKYYGMVADVKTFLENKKFIGQLTFYLQDCPTLHRKLQQTQYTTESIISLFTQYYSSCGHSEIHFKSKKKKIILEWGAVAGVVNSKLTFGGQIDQSYVLRSKFPSSYNPAAGMFLDIVLPGNQQKWSFYNELSYTSYTGKSEDDDILNVDQYTITRTTLTFGYAKFACMLRYRYPVGKTLMFVNAGLSNGFMINQTNHMVQETRIFTSTTTTQGKFLDEIRTNEQSYLLGLGTKLKRYSLEFRYEKGTGVSAYASLLSHTTRLYLLLSFRF